jgi:hypothetical protein
MKLSPWDALSDHQPLGSINRLRKIVYDMSRKKREVVNATATRPINSIDEIPRTQSPLISNEVSNRTIKIEDEPLEDYFHSAGTNTYFYKARTTTCVRRYNINSICETYTQCTTFGDLQRAH